MHIVLNTLLYAVLAYWLYVSIVDQDYWYAFVVSFVIIVALAFTLLPKYHASKTSPGEYPYED